MRYLTVLLCVGTLMCAVMVDAFHALRENDIRDADWPESPSYPGHPRPQLPMPATLDTIYSDDYPRRRPSRDWVVSPPVQQKRARSPSFRDPQWRHCISMCMDGCSMWDTWGGRHFQHCTRSCLREGYKNFIPENNCFQWQSKGRCARRGDLGHVEYPDRVRISTL